MAEETMPINDGAAVSNAVCDCNATLNCGCEEHEVNKCECPAINSRWGVIGHEIPGKFYQVYYGGNVLFDDEGIYDSFRANSEGKISTISVKSVIDSKQYPNFDWNKYGKAAYMESVEVSITANKDLSENNPLAHVIIDGKEYDLAVLNNPIVFVMNRDHRVSIAWNEDLVESFRIVKK